MRHPTTLKAKSKQHSVTRTGRGCYEVLSGHSGSVYTVFDLGDGTFNCNCEWSNWRPAANNGACGCSHVLAVVAFEQAEDERRTQVYSDLNQAKRQHRTILDIGDGLILTTRKA